jgi:tetratricopeptide (TPR) repeat protein
MRRRWLKVPMEWKQCLGLEGPIVDTVIDGCTAIILSGQEPREKLATAFDNRGVAYRRKGEYDRALEDYEQAMQLNPSNATAYMDHLSDQRRICSRNCRL